MSVAEISAEVNAKLDAVRATLEREVTGNGDVCLTCSFQAEDVLLTKLAILRDPRIPVLFLDTGYHFAETYAYRDRIAREWDLNLINLLPEKTVAEQEAEHGLLYQSAPDRCCGLRKVEPLFKAVAGYRVWLTGLRREQARSRAALEESGAVHAARRQTGAEAGAAGGVDHARRVVRVRTACDSAAAALCARLHLDRMRAVHHVAARSQRSALGPLGGAQGGVRNSHTGSELAEFAALARRESG